MREMMNSPSPWLPLRTLLNVAKAKESVPDYSPLEPLVERAKQKVCVIPSRQCFTHTDQRRERRGSNIHMDYVPTVRQAIPPFLFSTTLALYFFHE